MPDELESLPGIEEEAAEAGTSAGLPRIDGMLRSAQIALADGRPRIIAELDDTIAQRLEARFGIDEILVRRFDQLAEMRNRLRNSAQTDDISRQEGQVAVMWFRQVLPTRLGDD